jgi:Ribonuclease G/E
MHLDEGGSIRIVVNPEVDKILREEEQGSVIDLEKRTGKRIIITGKEHFHQEQYSVEL